MTHAQATEAIQLALEHPFVRDLDLHLAEDRLRLHLWLSGSLLVAYWPVYTPSVNNDTLSHLNEGGNA